MPTIVAVDDDPMILALIEVVAESRGVAFVGCESGAEFLRALETTPADLVIIDGLLPDTSGVRLAQRVLRGPPPCPKVMFLSAFFKDLRSARKLRTLRVDKIVHKPVDPRVLGRELEALLDSPAQPVRRRQSFDIGERLHKAAQEYRRDLPEKASELEQCLGGEQAAPDLEGLRMGVHRVAGSAGAYGLPGLSAAAAGLDARLQMGKPIEPMRGEMLRLIDEMRQASRVPAPPPSSRGLAHWPWALMVVSSDETLRGQLGRQLESEGITVELVDRLDQLSAALRSFVPDAILVDVEFAGPRGRAAADILTSIPTLALVAEPEGPNAVERDFPGRVLLGELRAAFPTPFEGAVVLSIDDDPTIATMCDAVLTPLGFAVEWADGFGEACEAMDDRAPDVILLDLTMPEMNGFQICRHLRADPRWEGLPIIVLSSRSGAEDRASAVRAGANDYMVKPVAARELVAKTTARVRERRTLALLARIDPDAD